MAAAAAMPVAVWQLIVVGRLIDAEVFHRRRLDMEIGCRRHAGNNQQDC